MIKVVLGNEVEALWHSPGLPQGYAAEVISPKYL